MKKKNVTLSELKNIIKEEIQFQLVKKQLVENVDSKTLRRILKEEDVQMVDVPINFDNIKVNYDTQNESGFAIISNNVTDTFNAIADNKITESYFMFNISFMVSIPSNIAKNTETLKFLKDSIVQKNYYKFTNDSLQITNYAAPITINNQNFTIKSASIVAKYPAAAITDLNMKASDIFNIKNFKGKPTL
jgi:hypothetical protein